MLEAEHPSELVVDIEIEAEHPPEAEVEMVMEAEHSLAPGPEMEAVTVLLVIIVAADSALVAAIRKGRRCCP